MKFRMKPRLARPRENVQREKCKAGQSKIELMTWKEGFIRFRSFWIFPALAVAVLVGAHQYEPTSRAEDLLWLLPIGIFVWTLIEYGLHRFVFHVDISNQAIRRIVNGSHIEHHQAPRDGERILVQTAYAIGVSTMLGAAITVLCRDLFWTAGILTGIWMGFLYYEAVHYRVHMTAGSGLLLTLQRRAHFYHHFHNANRCFGVTTPLWDYVFGTRASLSLRERAERSDG
jgi:4-hydroxysphinganine ceramide fatty acyl 2-hydroxylase